MNSKKKKAKMKKFNPICPEYYSKKIIYLFLKDNDERLSICKIINVRANRVTG